MSGRKVRYHHPRLDMYHDIFPDLLSDSQIFSRSICHKFWQSEILCHISLHSLWTSMGSVFWHSSEILFVIYKYSDIYISTSEILYLSYILTFYLSWILTFYLSHILTCYLAVCPAIRHSTWRYLIGHPLDSIWHTFRDSNWNSIWHPFWHVVGFCIWHFWATLLPKVVSLQILTSKFVIPSYEVFFSHHVIWRNGSGSPALASLLFDPRRPKNIGKTQHLPASSFYWFFLFSLFLFGLRALLFSDSAHLCCFIWPYCRKFDF